MNDFELCMIELAVRVDYFIPGIADADADEGDKHKHNISII